MNARITAQELEAKVSSKLTESGFPVERHSRLRWRSKYRPDIIFRSKGQSVAFEVKAHRLRLSDILQVGHLPVDKVLVIVPRGIKNQIADSVFDYANQQSVEIYDEDELEDMVSFLKAEYS